VPRRRSARVHLGAGERLGRRRSAGSVLATGSFGVYGLDADNDGYGCE
jgi:hypothetical protein